MPTRLEIVSAVENVIEKNIRNEGEDFSWIEDDTRNDIAELVADELIDLGYIVDE